MNTVYGKSIAAIEATDGDKFGENGGFTAVLSTPSLDRDGDRLHRDEWLEPLEERYPLDIDHGMSVADTVGSFHPYFDGDQLMMDAYFASTPKAQEVRTLVTEGHIRNVSVAFMTDKSKKDSEPRRELLNAGIVATPSNRDAVILASKAASALKDALSDATEGDVPEEVKEAVLEALSPKSGDAEVVKADKKPYGDVAYADPGYQEDGQARYPIDTEEHVRAALSYWGKASNRAEYTPEQREHITGRIHAAAEKFGIDYSPDGSKSVDADALKAAATASGRGGDAALVQAIHDASSHLGAACPIIETEPDPHTGASSGANKSVDEDRVTFMSKAGASIAFDSHDEAREFFKDMLDSIDSAEARDESLVEVTQTVEDEPSNLEAFEKALDEVLADDSPAEAAAATDEVPAPAVEAADEKAKRARALQLMQMRAQLPKS
jgi:hypothetical protein